MEDSKSLMHLEKYTQWTLGKRQGYLLAVGCVFMCVQMGEDTYRIGMHNNVSSRDKTLI